MDTYNNIGYIANMDQEEPKKSWRARAFNRVANGVKRVTGRTVKEATEFKDGIKNEVEDIRNETAEFLEHHGQGRIKTGTATAFKAGFLKATTGSTVGAVATKVGLAGKFAAKVGAVTAPVAKFTVPIAFGAGFFLGPYLSRKAAGALRSDDESEHTSENLDTDISDEASDESPENGSISSPPPSSGMNP